MNFYVRLPIPLLVIDNVVMVRWAFAALMLFATSLGLSQTAPVTDMGKVEITSGRDNDTQQRR